MQCAESGKRQWGLDGRPGQPGVDFGRSRAGAEVWAKGVRRWKTPAGNGEKVSWPWPSTLGHEPLHLPQGLRRGPGLCQAVVPVGASVLVHLSGLKEQREH